LVSKTKVLIHQETIKLGTNKRKRRETTLTFDFSNKKIKIEGFPLNQKLPYLEPKVSLKSQYWPTLVLSLKLNKKIANIFFNLS
jgi:hypothetical protein